MGEYKTEVDSCDNPFSERLTNVSKQLQKKKKEKKRKKSPNCFQDERPIDKETSSIITLKIIFTG
jgi:hypothetical protein